MRIHDGAAASLVSPRLPNSINHSLAIAQYAGVAVGAVVGRVARRQPKCFDMSASQANSEQGLSGVEGSGEDVRLEGKRASVLKHCDLGPGRQRIGGGRTRRDATANA